MTPPRNKKPGSMASLSQILPKVCADLDLDGQVQRLSVLSLWPAVAGNALAEKTRAVSLKKQGVQNILQVKAADAVVASELSYQLEGLLAELNRFEPQTGIRIHRIQLLVGSL